MTNRPTAALLALGLVAGCADRSTPTSASLEQGVFTMLGGLEVGESLTLRGAAAEVVFLAAQRLPAEYVLVPFHASADTGSRLWFEITAQGIEAAPSLSVSPPQASGAHSWPHANSHLDEAHQRLTLHTQAAVEPMIRATRQHIRRTGSRVRLSRSAVLPSPGELLTFNVDVLGHPCQSVDHRTGRVELVSQHAILVADTANPASGFTGADYARFAHDFDVLIHPLVTRYFDEPTDIDGNGRVIIFFTKAVNQLGAGGFVHGRDVLPRQACPASNEAEIFFQMVPDPRGEITPRPLPLEDVRLLTPGILGHEYQHLINAGRRVWINDADDFEEPWLNEALSHLAEELLFYAASGLEPRSNITFSMLSALSTEGSHAFESYQLQNLRRYHQFLRNPGAGSPIHGPSIPNRGAAWAFLRYVADHSGRSEEALFRGLVNSRLTGLDNLRSVVPGDPLEWLHGWALSVFLDDHAGAPADPRRRQPSWNFRDFYTGAAGDYPLQLHSLAPGAATRFNLLGGATLYVQLRSPAAEPGRVRTRWRSGAEGAPPPDDLRVTVVRTR